MEIKVNKEIQNYTETMFFGLTTRQCVCSVLAIVISVALYFLLYKRIGIELTTWACIIGAAPFAVLGFVKYHGMPAEKFIWAWLRSEILEPRRLLFKPRNIYYDIATAEIETQKKEGKPGYDENTEKGERN